MKQRTKVLSVNINTYIWLLSIGFIKYGFLGTLFVSIAYIVLIVDPLQKIIQDVSAKCSHGLQD
jgi:hypothetical protein